MLGIFGQKFRAQNPSVRATSNNVRERAAPIDPELPSRRVLSHLSVSQIFSIRCVQAGSLEISQALWLGRVPH